MIRKSLIVTVLAVAAAAAIVLPLSKSDAAQQPTSIGSQQGPASRALPNFDIRLTGRDEFNDMDLSSSSGKQAAMQNTRTRSQASAVEHFRSALTAEKAANVRAVVNEAGAMKNFFIDGGTLSEPQSDAADNIARKFLERHSSLFALPTAGIEELKLDNEDNDQGTTFLNYTQTVGGLKVFEGQVQVVVNKNGEVLNVREGFLVDGPPLRRRGAMNEAKALAKAFEHAGRNVFPSFVEIYSRQSTMEQSRFANPLDLNFEEVLSEQVVLRVADESRLAWHVFLEVGPEEWYEILLDTYTGELLLRHNLYRFEAQGTVYTEAPDKGARQLVSFVGDTTINTAAGWMGTSTVTTGNNVEAYLDSDANNVPDNNNGPGLATGHASAANQDFTFPFDTTVDPRTQQAAVVTNLFYFNNFMHDFSYNLGFTETARNFQVNNFGRGGVENDSVRAEAEHGSGTNNADFATPPDGSRPRMQQFLFTSSDPARDSSVDGDVVFHEYGHGISNRLIGNGSNALSGTQSGAMGEGWSDYWAITINNDGAVAEYVKNNPVGIRRAAYSVPAAAVHDSYADLGSSSLHNDGEVWAATLWDLRTQLGAATTDRIVLNGMKFTPNLPSFLNGRDGILQADQNLNGGANRCAIWTVFARHGMGVSAVGNDGHTHTSATDVPTDCGATPPARLVISEFRFRGPAGLEDEYIQLTNITGQSITVSTADGSSGWALAAISSTGSVSTKFVIPNGTIIPQGGHYLAANSAYSLTGYAAADRSFTGDISDNTGIALFRTANPANFILNERIDAAGFTPVTNSLYQEGAALTAITPGTNEYAHVRKMTTLLPRDTDNNSSDFVAISTSAAFLGGVSTVLGAPGPENSLSPLDRTSQVAYAVLDPGVSSTAAPNRVRNTTPVPNGALGTLVFRNRVTNNTGFPVTRLRWRIIDFTTTNSPVVLTPPQAVLTMLDSTDSNITLSNGTTVSVKGTKVEQPPNQPNAGGLNSTHAPGGISISTPLQPGQTLYYELKFGVQGSGSLRYNATIELLLSGGG